VFSTVYRLSFIRHPLKGAVGFGISGAAREENVQTTGGGVFHGERGDSVLNDKGDIVPSVRGVIKNCLDGFCGFDFNAKTVFPIFPPYPCACLFSTNR